MNDVQNSKKTILVVGATGYIGSAVVAEAVRSGHQVVAVTRSRKNDSQFEGAEVVMADVSDPASIARAFNRKIDVVISCLATRSGVARDFDDIDYKATLNVLNAAKQNGTSQFILLSAICVRKPDLPLQLAKLKMEDELIRSGMHYTIVRPTAYFWVFDSQSRNIKKGKPGFLLGSGEQARHNPIAKEDLAEFMVGCAGSSEHINRIHIIGGPEVPGNIISSRDALLMIFEAMGKEPKLISVPTWLFQAAIGISGFIGHFWRKSGVFHEFLRIIYYYSHDDMRAPGYGSRTIRQYIMQASSSAAD